VATAANLAVTPSAAVAQVQTQNVVEYVVRSTDPNVPDLDVRSLRGKGFQLFASGDGGLSGFRMTGRYGARFDNYGPCTNVLAGCQSVDYQPARAGGGTPSPYFHLEWTYGAPPSEWRKIRRAFPAAANATGGGFTATGGDQFLGRPTFIGPRDGTLGRLASGVLSTTDGSCRDFQGFLNARVPGGIPLLAGSGCPDTWGAATWLGDAPVDEAGWKSQFDQQGVGFQFDFWRVPTDVKRTDKQFLGTGWTTYGESSDFWQQGLARFGSAVPGGTGTPAVQGYPLGLVIRSDIFTFAVPTLANLQFVQTLIINRSLDVWGQPIDYDSIYFGLSPGDLGATQNAQSRYYLPELGTALHMGSNRAGTGGPCDQAFRQPTGVGGCLANNNAGRGYFNGGWGTIVLKSPLGDLRNKLFTRTPGSIVNGATQGAIACTPGVNPFCMPTHPSAGDTITYNHAKQGGFGSADLVTYGSGLAQAIFGLISSTEANTIAGRDINAWTAGQRFGVFRNIGYPAVFAQYNKYVPGVGGSPGAVWDWNHDGAPDTLFMDGCGPAGCVPPGGDTLPGGHKNLSGNVGGTLAFGPFPLRAGDTTSFVFATFADGDSSSVWSTINSAIDLYLNFYLSPEAPPPVAITATQVTAGSDGIGSTDPEVRIFFSEAPERWRDAFLLKLANDIEGAAPGTPLEILRLDNPTIVSQIRARAIGNLEAIEIYKSCDGGTTFTDDNDCLGDETRDDRGQVVGLGWSPYRVFTVDGNQGNPPNFFEDDDVDAGRTYLYTIVGKSRGAKFFYLRRTDPLNPATLVPDTISFVGSIRNPLSRSTSDQNVASLYVPVSRQAGHQAATAGIVEGDTRVTVPVEFTLSDAVRPGTYRAFFGNRIQVIRDSTVSPNADDVFQSMVVVADTALVDGGAGADVVQVLRADTLIRANGEVFPVAGGLALNANTGADRWAPVIDTIVAGTDSTFRVTTTYFSLPAVTNDVAAGGPIDLPAVPSLGFVIASEEAPLFLTIFPTNAAGSTPPGVFTLSDFPGFTVTANQSSAGTFNTNAEAQIRGAASIARQRLTAADTIVTRGLVNANMVQFSEAAPTTRVNNGGGVYEVTWLSDPFGTDLGFPLNRTNPTGTQAEVNAALVARPVGTTALTDTVALRLLNSAPVSLGITQEDLVALKMPFTIRNTTFNRDVLVAMPRRFGATSSSIVLGNLGDTVRITVPDDQWVAGDRLYLIEDVVLDSMIGGAVVLDGSGNPIQVTTRQVTHTGAALGCNTPRVSCNPVPQGTPGATGYIPMLEGDRTRWVYFTGFDPLSQYTFDLVGPVTGEDITQVTDSALRAIRVVPNPFVVFSQYQGTNAAESRIAFTGLPGRGVLRIYTVSGQFVQQISWTPTELLGDGDLYYDLRSRENIDIASGLYIWVITAPSNPNDPNSAPLTARGKFVVIRGSAN
jgi:hypothetical protein